MITGERPAGVALLLLLAVAAHEQWLLNVACHVYQAPPAGHHPRRQVQQPVTMRLPSSSSTTTDGTSSARHRHVLSAAGISTSGLHNVVPQRVLLQDGILAALPPTPIPIPCTLIQVLGRVRCRASSVRLPLCARGPAGCDTEGASTPCGETTEPSVTGHESADHYEGSDYRRRFFDIATPAVLEAERSVLLQACETWEWNGGATECPWSALASVPTCQWPGIRCIEDGRVIKV